MLQASSLQFYWDWEKTPAQVFSCEFLWNFVEHIFNTSKWLFLRWTKMLLKNVFCLSYLKLTSPDHINSNYQLMFLMFEVSYHYQSSFQNVSFSLIEKSTVVDQKVSVKKFLDYMIGVVLIVLPFLNNRYRRASGKIYFPDIYLRAKWTEHMLSIRYFAICAKAGYMAGRNSVKKYRKSVCFQN